MLLVPDRIGQARFHNCGSVVDNSYKQETANKVFFLSGPNTWHLNRASQEFRAVLWKDSTSQGGENIPPTHGERTSLPPSLVYLVQEVVYMLNKGVVEGTCSWC